jgi:hypothetical protein
MVKGEWQGCEGRGLVDAMSWSDDGLTAAPLTMSCRRRHARAVFRAERVSVEQDHCFWWLGSGASAV